MSNMCDYLEKKLLDHTLGITAYTKPAGDYLGLHTASPTDTGSFAAEVTQGGYARQAITAAMSATDATSGQSSNGSTITAGPSTADWGTITHIGIDDALTTGNMLLWGALTSSRLIQSGDSFQVAVGQLSITFA